MLFIATLNCSHFTKLNIFRYVPPPERVEVTSVLEKKSRDSPEKSICWVNQPDPRNDMRRPGRRPANNILRQDSGCVRGEARNKFKEVECFELFMDNSIQQIILEETNKKISRFNQEHQNGNLNQKHLPDVRLCELQINNPWLQLTDQS